MLQPCAAHARAKLSSDERDSIELFKQNTPSVVYITNMASRCPISHPLLAGPHAPLKQALEVVSN